MNWLRSLQGVLGRKVPVQQVDDATYASIMSSAGVPEPVVPILVEIQKVDPRRRVGSREQ